jgi:uncharacterized protein (DUF1697 family)
MVVVEKTKLTDENYRQFWFKLEHHGDPSNVWVVSPEWVQRVLGINALKQQVQDLKDRVYKLERPIRQDKIIQLLKADNQVHGLLWIQRRLSISYWDLEDLVDKKVLRRVKHGTKTMYELVKESE